MIKKFKLLLLVVLLSLIFVACDPGTYMYDYDDLINHVTSIELINYTNEEQTKFSSWVPDHFDDLKSIELSNISIVETLNEDGIESFLQSLSSVYILNTYYSFDSPKGICIRLTYDDGNFEVITADYENKSYIGYIGQYLSNGEVYSFVGVFDDYESFKNLVNNFFEYQLN